MAGFCGNCGFKLNDGDMVCGNCGTPVAGIPVGNPAANQAGMPNPNMNPGQAPSSVSLNAKNSSKIVMLGIAAVAVIFVLIVGLVVVNFITQNTGYKGTVKKMVGAMEDEDIDTLEEVASFISEEVYRDTYYGDYDEFVEKSLDDVLDKYEDAVGNIDKIGYTIEDVREISERRIKNMKEILEDFYDIDVDDIDDIRILDLRITVTGSRRSANYTPENLYLIKEDGSWKIHYGLLNY